MATIMTMIAWMKTPTTADYFHAMGYGRVCKLVPNRASFAQIVRCLARMPTTMMIPRTTKCSHDYRANTIRHL